MFLNAFNYDFDDTPNRDVSSDSDSEDSLTDADRGASLTTLWNTPLIKPKGSPLHSPSSHIDMNVPLWPLHLNLSPSQSFLWNYFHEAIAPACVLNPQLNPYRDVILRIAASMGNTSPLFHCIMAISASQLYVLGDRKFYQTSCDYRHQALHRLRLETAKLECTPVPATSSAHVLATVMTLVFLDVSILQSLNSVKVWREEERKENKIKMKLTSDIDTRRLLRGLGNPRQLRTLSYPGISS